MEYCPEIAVLHSAFQLVIKKAGKALQDLPKEKCCECLKIISATVDEICTGLQHDLDLEEKLQWKEKLHLVHFYALVKKKYKGDETQAVEGKVPVSGDLDMIADLLPTFNSSFYFELMKQSDWTKALLQSLQHLDYATASVLFEDLLKHCQNNPVTLDDRKVITMVTDKLLSRCLCVPDYPSELCIKLLEPLTQSRKYIQTVYPDEKLNEVTTVTMEMRKNTKLGIEYDTNTNKVKVGINFFDTYVEQNPKLLDMVMTHYESRLDCITRGQKVAGSLEILEIVSQLGIWKYLGYVKLESGVTDEWFINNVQLVERRLKPGCVDTRDLVYSLNFSMLQSIFKSFPQRQIDLGLQKALSLVCNWYRHGDHSGSTETAILGQRSRQGIQVVNELTVNWKVLLRMIAGVAHKSLGSESSDAEMADLLKLVLQREAELWDPGEGIVTGDMWSEDVTLEALLRRVDHKLPQYQVCVDRLLEDRNMKFWKENRLYSVIKKHPALLSRVDRILRLIHILESLKGDNCGGQGQLLLNLICAAFSELSFPDQDTVVMEIYCSSHSSLSKFFSEGLAKKVTNVFNKVTADMDNQILSEVILLCLGDPVLVLKMAINLCVRNEQQAVNSAVICQQLARTCMSRHPVQHPDTSLLALLVQDFLSSQSLSEKEQKSFCVFVSEIMRPCGHTKNKNPVLSPTEFLHTSVLPFVSLDNLLSSSQVSCNFAASLLLLALEAGCNKKCDWSEYEFEPMALILSLVEVKHECIVLWEMNKHFDKDSNEEGNVNVAMETNSSKLALRETINKCFSKLIQMVQEEYLVIQQHDMRWLLEATSDIHWTVRFGLCPLFSACNFQQYGDEWLLTLDSLLVDLNANLVPVLQFVTVDRRLVPRILDHIVQDTQIDSCELIVSLMQVLPQCLIREFESVVLFLEGLLSSESVHVAVVYRLRSTFNLPLLNYSEVRPGLYISQLLGDMIITLATTLTSEKERMSMLPHVIQCYVSGMKERCGHVSERRELQLFYLGELFHHVCEVTLNLPAEIMDSALVFLLHILNQFKDVAIATVRGHRKVKTSVDMLKMVKNVENGMMAAVQELPDNCEEKHMIIKKLSDQS